MSLRYHQGNMRKLAGESSINTEQSKNCIQKNQSLDRELMTPSELANMSDGRCILYFQGLSLFYYKTYDFK